MSRSESSQKTPFVRHHVDGLYSVAHLFPQAGRCGIYILEFKNGERYVGQSVDVVRRFGNHRRVHADIEHIQFSKTSRANLDELELATIRHQRSAGHRLRNITHSLGPPADSDLDPIITPSEQYAWLADASVNLAEGLRSDDPKQRSKGLSKYERLREHDAFPIVVTVLNAYVRNCLPRAAETERTFWSLSALPSTNGGARLATLSVNKMETLFTGVGELPDSSRFLFTTVNVSRSRLEEEGSLAALRRQHKNLVFKDASYEAGGGDVVSIRSFDIEGIFAMFDLPGFTPAARALNLMLMRKGPTMQWRWHNYALADWVFLSDEELDEHLDDSGAEQD